MKVKKIFKAIFSRRVIISLIVSIIILFFIYSYHTHPFFDILDKIVYSISSSLIERFNVPYGDDAMMLGFLVAGIMMLILIPLIVFICTYIIISLFIKKK